MVDADTLRIGNWLNFLVAVLVLVIGLLFFFLSPLLKKKNFLKVVLAFWLGQWFVFALAWGRIICTYPQKNDYWVLGLGDLQSMLAIGFSIAFLFGEEVKDRFWGIFRGLGLTYLLLVLINVAAVGALAGGSKSMSDLRDFFLSQWVSTGSVIR